MDGLRSRCWFVPRLNFIPLVLKQWSLTSNGENLAFLNPNTNVNSQIVLGNENSANTSQISLSLKAKTNKVTTQNPVVAYNDITPRANAQPKEVSRIKIHPDVDCGDKIKFEAIAKSNQGSAKFVKSLYVGKLEELFMGSIEVNKPIPPDGSYGAVSPFFIDQSFPVSRVRAKIVYTHDVPSDLRYFISAPNGEEFPLVMTLQTQNKITTAESAPFDLAINF